MHPTRQGFIAMANAVKTEIPDSSLEPQDRTPRFDVEADYVSHEQIVHVQRGRSNTTDIGAGTLTLTIRAGVFVYDLELNGSDIGSRDLSDVLRSIDPNGTYTLEIEIPDPVTPPVWSPFVDLTPTDPLAIQRDVISFKRAWLPNGSAPVDVRHWIDGQEQEASFIPLPPMEVEIERIDADGDGDGVPYPQDNCLLVSNSNQYDLDHDGVGDVCDNCLRTPNPDQRDTDNDGPSTGWFGMPSMTGGDACDLDDDNDGILDVDDLCPTVDTPWAEDDQAAHDLDGDGNGYECDPDDQHIEWLRGLEIRFIALKQRLDARYINMPRNPKDCIVCKTSKNLNQEIAALKGEAEAYVSTAYASGYITKTAVGRQLSQVGLDQWLLQGVKSSSYKLDDFYGALGM
jgi:hypothetical protein